MSISGTAIALLILLVWWLLILYLDKQKVLERHNLQAFGPILMIRTKRGLTLLDRASTPSQFWRFFGDLGLLFMIFGMVTIFTLVLFSDIFMLINMPEPSRVNEPRNWLLIPGVNEFIPAWGWLGLIVTLIVHEFAHGILARVEGVRVKSMGLLLAVIPIGAFAEPDEEEMFGSKDGQKPSKISTRSRNRILAAGVMSNFLVAVIAFSLFFGPVLSMLEPAGSDLVITEVADGFRDTGLHKDMIVRSVNGIRVNSVDEISAMGGDENGMMRIEVLDRGTQKFFTLHVEKGVRVWEVIAGEPADTAGIRPGQRIIEMNGVPIDTAGDFYEFMQATRPHDLVTVKVANDKGEEGIFQLELGEFPDPDEKKGFLGVVVYNTPFGMVGEFQSDTYLTRLKHLPTSFFGWLTLMALPVIPVAQGGFGGFGEWLMQFYTPTWGGKWTFYLANALFWIGWINFYAGLFNCLPAIPLDGGYIFKGIVERFSKLLVSDPGRQKKMVDRMTLALALFILASILFMLVGPYIIP
ncbi:MAG TPA: PDZ domain-containing protein [Candidatus Syntrophoarchaeum butanivorans]|uniref:Membrane-associated Zn-dependent proteases 1 n=1 Tax=Candidatus Syntropharchaeum butanivorans TaxID=1839936 RepID=A0A1F2P675_9EURY|nr:MAG: membrane-associated Zn-dependent proteases 1 [Candidatus Syntrophoarchaeum butanivorans]HEC57191.1 PDZ domain-containing protein [Candidatus Syntrophoarchaeum butanivorans]